MSRVLSTVDEREKPYDPGCGRPYAAAMLTPAKPLFHSGTKALPANWFVWPGHARGYDQAFRAEAIMRAGFPRATHARLHLIIIR